jgi:hypothetical protein
MRPLLLPEKAAQIREEKVGWTIFLLHVDKFSKALPREQTFQK